MFAELASQWRNIADCGNFPTAPTRSAPTSSVDNSRVLTGLGDWQWQCNQICDFQATERRFLNKSILKMERSRFRGI
jgi:hypothetical protein